MNTLVAAVVLALGQDAAEELGKAAQGLAGLANYTFRIELASDAGKKNSPGTMECVYQKDVGMYGKGSHLEMVRIGDKVAVKDSKAAEWTRVSLAEGKADKDQKRLARLVRGVNPPGDELAGIEKKLKSVARTCEGDLSVYSGELTDEAARDLLWGAGRGKNPAAAGSVKVFVNAQGRIVKYQIDGSLKITKKDGQDVEVKISKTVEISNEGSTKVEIPEEAKKALED